MPPCPSKRRFEQLCAGHHLPTSVGSEPQQ
jgi:hypothetical protein